MEWVAVCSKLLIHPHCGPSDTPDLLYVYKDSNSHSALSFAQKASFSALHSILHGEALVGGLVIKHVL